MDSIVARKASNTVEFGWRADNVAPRVVDVVVVPTGRAREGVGKLLPAIHQICELAVHAVGLVAPALGRLCLGQLVQCPVDSSQSKASASRLGCPQGRPASQPLAPSPYVKLLYRPRSRPFRAWIGGTDDGS